MFENIDSFENKSYLHFETWFDKPRANTSKRTIIPDILIGLLIYA